MKREQKEVATLKAMSGWSRRGWNAYALILTSAVLLVSFCLLAASCGGKQGDGSGGKGGSEAPLKISDQGDVDALLQDIDAVMNSVDAGDFSQDQLSDSQLGL